MLTVSLMHTPGFKPQPLSTKSLRISLLLGCTPGGPRNTAGLQEGLIRTNTGGTGVELSCQGPHGALLP